MKKSLLLLLFLISFQLSAQVIGKVSDTEGNPLSYVNIYLKDSYTGTTSNDAGNYSLDISREGTYQIVFQFLGFKTHTETIRPGRFPYILDVVLQEESTDLGEVVLESTEDPAYRVIRKTIAERKKNLERLREYTADFYSRGLWQVKDVPEKILGQEIGNMGGILDTTRSGILDLSER